MNIPLVTCLQAKEIAPMHWKLRTDMLSLCILGLFFLPDSRHLDTPVYPRHSYIPDPPTSCTACLIPVTTRKRLYI